MQLQAQLSALQNQVKQLRIRAGLGLIDKDTFDVTIEHLGNQEVEISKDLDSRNATISNLEKFISSAFKKLTKLITVWVSSDLEGKRILQRTLFPEGFF